MSTTHEGAPAPANTPYFTPRRAGALALLVVPITLELAACGGSSHQNSLRASETMTVEPAPIARYDRATATHCLTIKEVLPQQATAKVGSGITEFSYETTYPAAEVPPDHTVVIIQGIYRPGSRKVAVSWVRSGGTFKNPALVPPVVVVAESLDLGESGKTTPNNSTMEHLVFDALNNGDGAEKLLNCGPLVNVGNS